MMPSHGYSHEDSVVGAPGVGGQLIRLLLDVESQWFVFVERTSQPVKSDAGGSWI